MACFLCSVLRCVLFLGVSSFFNDFIDILGQSAGRPMPSFPANRGVGPRRRGGLRNGMGRGQTQSRGGRSGRGRGRGWGGGRGKKQEKSAEELDKELESYHAEGMQIS